MPRRFTGDILVVASHNPGKAAEIRALIGRHVRDIRTAGDLGLPEPEETGRTFTENAVLKARAAAERAGLPALADDSGLVVASLGGAPGVCSARWGGADRNFRRAMERVERALAGQTDRSAAFVSALALAWPDGHVEHFEGRVDGSLVWPPRGERGFGYDPIFVPDGHDRTFGEMSGEEKDRISHRARAFAQLVAACFAAG